MRRLLPRLLKLPGDPSPPPGSRETLRIFRASPAYFRYLLLSFFLKQAGALFGILFSLTLLPRFFNVAAIIPYFFWIEVFALASFLVQGVAGFAFLRLRYEMRWYLVGDQVIRIREGIFKIREQTMTVANIQNIAVRQGPVQKFFGISDLELRTAGGGSKDGDDEKKNNLHIGLLEGLDNVDMVRGVIRDALALHRDAGLGDPDEVSVGTADGGELLEAARGLREEAARLRGAFETAGSGPHMTQGADA